MPSANDQATKTTVYANIRGYVLVFDEEGENRKQYPLASFRGTFRLNSIPHAEFVIPTGRAVNSDSDEEVILPRELAEACKQFRRVEVYVRIRGDFAPEAAWPDEPIRVFNGYISGTNTVRSANAVSFVVHASHWLTDLDASSALSEDVVVGAPVAITLPAVTPDLGSRKNDVPDVNLVENLPTNLWAEGLKPLFVNICNGGTVITTLLNKPGLLANGAGGTVTNDRALRRLEPATGDEPFFDDPSRIDVPRLQMEQDLNLILRETVARAVTDQLYNGSLGTSTLWEKLLEIAAMFELTVVPNIDSCTVAAISPSMAGSSAVDDVPRHVTVAASEYWTFAPSEPVFRMWRGLILNGHFPASDTGSVDANLVPNYAVLLDAGIYLADQDNDLDGDVKDRAAKGIVRFAEAPIWLQDSVAWAARKTPKTVEPTMNNDQRDTVEGEGAQATPDEPEPADEQRDPEIVETLGSYYAKHQYWLNQFLPRTGRLIGKFRLDIAPGTIVRIEDLSSKLYADNVDFSYKYALVSAVQITVDAVGGTAETELMLSHVRREGEKSYGIDKHPLYKNEGDARRWVGTVLQAVELNVDSNEVFYTVPGEHEVA